MKVRRGEVQTLEACARTVDIGSGIPAIVYGRSLSCKKQNGDFLCLFRIAV